MGHFIKSYIPQANINRFINDVVTTPRYAFSVERSIVIVGQKEFPDVSFYQKLIDWDQMRAKTDTVIIRSGQNLWDDPQFVRNYSEAKARSMKRGIYRFYDDRVSPGKQAELLINQVKNDMPEMEIWADWENTYGGAYGGLGNVVAFMQAIEAALPTAKVGMYTGYYWFREHSNAITNANQYNYLKTKPLWLAWYTNNPEIVLIPAPWTSLLLWQRGTPVLDYGQETAEIDMNVVNLTNDQFYQRYGGTVTPPPDGETMITYEVRSNKTGETRSIRTGPGILFSKITDLPIGGVAIGTSDDIYTYKDKIVTDGVQRSAIDDQWIRISAPIDGWLAIKHISIIFATLTAIPTPPDDVTIASIHMSQEMVFDYSDGRQEVYRIENAEVPKAP